MKSILPKIKLHKKALLFAIALIVLFFTFISVVLNLRKRESSLLSAQERYQKQAEEYRQQIEKEQEKYREQIEKYQREEAEYERQLDRQEASAEKDRESLERKLTVSQDKQKEYLQRISELEERQYVFADTAKQYCTEKEVIAYLQFLMGDLSPIDEGEVDDIKDLFISYNETEIRAEDLRWVMMDFNNDGRKELFVRLWGDCEALFYYEEGKIFCSDYYNAYWGYPTYVPMEDGRIFYRNMDLSMKMAGMFEYYKIGKLTNEGKIKWMEEYSVIEIPDESRLAYYQESVAEEGSIYPFVSASGTYYLHRKFGTESSTEEKYTVMSTQEQKYFDQEIWDKVLWEDEQWQSLFP